MNKSIKQLLWIRKLILAVFLSSVLVCADSDTIDVSDNSNIAKQCTCFKVNASDSELSPVYFTNYAFLDFRHLDGSVNDPKNVNNSQNGGHERITSNFFDQSKFTTTWEIQNWSQPQAKGDPATSRWKVVNSAQNIYIDRDASDSTTHLSLRTSRLTDFQSCAEIDTPFTMQYASMRARTRVSGSPGAVAGIFFYQDDNSESDIEILTQELPNKSKYHASNQPTVDSDGNQIPGSSDSHAVEDWSEWNNYRLDWVPGKSIWAVNGKHSDTKTYGVPKGPAQANLNMWGNGGVWSGEMAAGKEARMDLAWVELVYNGSKGSEGCGSKAVTCDVDGKGGAGNLAVMQGRAVRASASGMLRVLATAAAGAGGLVAAGLI